MTEPLRFLTFLAPNMKPVYEHIVVEVGRQLEIPTELMVGRTYVEALQESTDLAFICGLPYVELTGDAPDALVPLAAPVLEDLREAIGRVVLGLHENKDSSEFLAQGVIKRFVEVDSSSYDDIRGMLQRAERAGFTEIH